MPLVSKLAGNFFEVRFPFAGLQEDTARYFTNDFLHRQSLRTARRKQGQDTRNT